MNLEELIVKLEWIEGMPERLMNRFQKDAYVRAKQQERRTAWIEKKAKTVENYTRRGMIGLFSGLLGALSQYSAPPKRQVFSLFSPTLDDHLKSKEMKLGSYVIGIDPSIQEERIYKVVLKEVARTRVSTAKIPGKKKRGGDGRTPENSDEEYFVITNTVYSGDWIDPFNNQSGAYGPYFARIDTPDEKIARMSGGHSPIGLHGTNEFVKLGSRASHGCIRHANADIEFFNKQGYLASGTPVVIRSGLFGEQAL